jgi:HAD superfamily hydrolase (TIGR01549 family)
MSGSEILATRKHWVFDLDGTLTVAVHDFNAIRYRLGIPAGTDILDHLASLPQTESSLLHSTLQDIEDELAEMTSAAAGARQLLENLQVRGVRVGILTRNSRRNAVRTLELVGLKEYFETDHILGRDEVLPKPAPDGIYHLAKQWNTVPGETVMVGDYMYDLQAGRAAGAVTIHVDSARDFRWPELSDVTVVDLQELSDRIDILIGSVK